LFNWLYARHTGGQFILRIEDTDLERSKPEFEADITEGLQWLGLAWDNDQLYRQSERMNIYREYLAKLMDAGKAEVRTFSEDEKAEIARQGRVPRDSIIVLKQERDEEEEVTMMDEVRGNVAVQLKHVGSLALAKDEGSPLYNFAVVVDDIEMGITHVIRGEDHISNTPKQLLIYEALGVTPPVFAHLPLILGTDRSKLSKRHGAMSVNEYRADYLPDALVNFMGMLGYTYDREILSKEEMAEQFELAKVHKAGAIFDTPKLDWLNAQYLKRMGVSDFKHLIGKPTLPDAAVPIMTERLERLSHVEQFGYLWEAPEYEGELLIWKQDDEPTALKALSMCALLADGDALNQTNLDTAAQEHFGGRRGSIYWPLRVALSGRKASAGPLDIAAVIGMDEVKARVETAMKKLSA
jgi:glutamyl/glutaminyl-tRNA synthetase